MSFQALIFIAFVSVPQVWAASSGDVGVCTVDNNFGCSEWEGGDRLKCIDAQQGIMPWAARPVRAPQYSLRTGDGAASEDSTAYAPGELVRLYVRTLEYGWNYRGLMIHAVDSNQATVGEWVFPRESNAFFWHPPQCSKGVAIHVSAEVKPALVDLLWKAPAQGTGTVTFKTLVKKGPANEGEFYHAMDNDLTLTEKAPLTQTWFQGNTGESCTAVCNRLGGTCDDARMTQLSSTQALEQEVTSFTACNLPFLSGCGSTDPSVKGTQTLCSFSDSTCASWRASTAPSTCSATPPSGSRICPCSTVGPTEPPTGPCTNLDCGEHGDCNPDTGTCTCDNGWTGDLCQNGATTCRDGVQNGQETGIDCGGPACPACLDYKWFASDWSECQDEATGATVTCGGGVKTRTVECRDNANNKVADSMCEGVHPEEKVMTCNEQPCAVYSWMETEWTDCSSECLGGTRTRTVTCQSSIGNTLVDSSFCDAATKPLTKEDCNTHACTTEFHWAAGEFGPCSKTCGGGTMQREPAVCTDSQGNPADDAMACAELPEPVNVLPCNTELCRVGVWEACPWDECTTVCGGNAASMSGTQDRWVFCRDPRESVVVDSSLCPADSKPVQTLEGCNPHPCEGPYWMSTPWTVCKDGIRRRTSHCHSQDGQNAPDEDCPAALKPVSMSPCVDNQCPEPITTIPVTPRNPAVPPELSAALSRSPCAPLHLVLASLALLLSSASRRGSAGSLHSSLAMLAAVTVLLVLGNAGTAEAHNWLFTPGRATTQASTVRPCQARKATDLHAQLGPGQEMVLKWATGHSRPSYVVVIAGKDYHELGDPNFIANVEKYMKDAEANGATNTAQQPKYQRFHGAKEHTSFYDSSDMYKEKVASTDPHFLTHDHHETLHLWRYNLDKIQADIRVSYKSTEFEWLESAYKFDHMYHLPNDYDAITMGIPARSGPGHYIVHWRWNGYYDCVDVDVRDTQVEKVYGNFDGTYVFNQIDHCQYMEPKAYDTKILEVVVGPEVCMRRMDRLWKRDRGYRLGINVVPVTNPSTVFPAWKDIINIPWHVGGTVGTSWTLLSGTETNSDDAESVWTAWGNTYVNRQASTRCSGGTAIDGTVRLKHAVAMCVATTNCKGVSWQMGASTATYPSTGTHTFELCTSTTTAADGAGWVTFWSKSLPTMTAASGVDVKISFEAARLSDKIARAGTLADIGEVYGARNGHTYGWNCENDCYTCSNNKDNPTVLNTYTWGLAPDLCKDDKTQKKWEFAVDNGVYEVATFSDRYNTQNTIGLQGCAVENSMMSTATGFSSPNPVTYTRVVTVEDGKITLNGYGGRDHEEFCQAINTIAIKKIGQALPHAWIPSQSNPWWQMDLGQKEPIGVVRVRIPEFGNCGAWWLYKGNGCQEGKPLADFDDEASQGAVVGVSDAPCSGTKCSGTQCGRIYNARQRDNYVNCAGKQGRYVWVQLPGAQRVFVADIQVNRATPATATADTKVCYGVEARTMTATTPEYVVSLDPEDPIFYSTCYAQEKNIQWLGVAPPKPDAQWRFAGKCVECESFEKNRNPPIESEVPTWVVSNTCVDCHVETAPVSPPSTTWKQAYKGAYCRDNRHTCTEGACLKSLFPGARHSSDDYGDSRVTYETCVALAERDPECGSSIQWAVNNNYVPRGECKCYKSTECCGRCTSSAGTSPSVWSIWDSSTVSVTPDATCANGIKSADGSFCCASTCVDASGNSLCDVSGKCDDAVGGGMCCKLYVERSCSDAGPPCLL